MPVQCPQCSTVNPDGIPYCGRCGYAFQAPRQAGPMPGAQYGVAAPPSGQYRTGAPVSGQYGVAAPPSRPLYGTSPQAAQIGANTGGASLRRAFAGHGALVMHQSWLLDGDQAHANSVRATVIDLMRRRGILGTSILPEKLTERGIAMEVRDYITIRRGVSTVYTYIAPAGQDLYISRATTVLPAISRVRALAMALLAVLLLIGLASRPSTSSLGASVLLGGGPSMTDIVLSACAFGLLLPFFFLFFIASVISWAVEKDFWVYLRPRTLNDFQLDDIALLEHATDSVVTDAVKHEGLDASKITPPPQGYQPKRRIRAV